MIDYNVLADRLKGLQIDGEDLTPKSLEEAIKKEDKVEIEATKVTILNDTELTELKNTVKESASTGSTREGVISGAEQIVKAIKNTNGLEFEGKVVMDGDKVDFEETAKNVSKKFSTKILEEAKIPEQEKVNKLQESLERLQGNFEKKEQELESFKTQSAREYSALQQDFNMQSSVVVEGLKPSHVVAGYKADGFGFVIENGEQLLTKNGEKVLDEVEKPVEFAPHFKKWQEDNFVNVPSGGRGAGSEGGSGGLKFKTENDVFKHMEENGIDPTSTEGEKLLTDFNQNQKVA